MKNIIFLLCCIFYMSALGQSHFVEDTPEVRNWLDNMFQHLDKSKIPHGLLRDYAFELADLDIYNGKELNDSIMWIVSPSRIFFVPFAPPLWVPSLSMQKRFLPPNTPFLEEVRGL